MGEGAITRERILAEALGIFARHGFEGARIEKITAQVGINKASLYFYFKSKDELFQELFLNIIQRYRAFIKQVIAESEGLPLRERLIVIYQKYLNDSWDNSEMDFWNRVFYFPPEALKEEIRHKTYDTEMEFIESLISVFEEGIKRGEIRPLEPKRMAKTYYYLLTCISLSVDLFSKSQGLNDMENCFSVFWEGIKP